MSRKYIRQQNNLDFFYPNYDRPEYDIEIIHDVNNNCVSGSVVTFSATTISSTGITFNILMTWSSNGATPWVRNSNNLGIYSVHMLAPGQDYFKPWRIITSRSFNPYTGQTSYTDSLTSFLVTPSQMGLTGFTDGVYYFEVRFIGHDCTYNVCFSQSLVAPTPAPTATPTPTPSPTLTPTPTPTGPTPTPTTTPTVTPTPTPTATGDFELDPQYGITFDNLTVGGGNSLPSFTFPVTGNTFLPQVQGYNNGTTFFATISGTRTPPGNKVIVLYVDSISHDCAVITNDPSGDVVPLTLTGSTTTSNNITISIGNSTSC